MRKTSHGHRCVRKGVLIARRARWSSACSAALLALALALVLAGCAPRVAERAAPTPGEPGGAAAGARWFQLQDGAFQSIPDPGAIRATEQLPWTVQARVADMAFLDGTLYLAVNGHGVAEAVFDSAGVPTLSTSSDSLIFAHRTITALFPWEGELLAHLYYNALLNTVLAADLDLRGISLVAYMPARHDYRFLMPPFQRKNLEWESVGFAALSTGQFILEWKYSNESETRFAYTEFLPDTGGETKSTRDAYIKALSPASINDPSLPPQLSRLFEACLAEAVRADSGAHFIVRSREDPMNKSYRIEGSGGSVVRIPVFVEDGLWLALLPGERVLRFSSDEKRGVVALPSLPEGMRYTDMVKVGETLVIPWEQARFTDVGAAGVLVYSPQEQDWLPEGSG